MERDSLFASLSDRRHIPQIQRNVVSGSPGGEVVEGAIAVVAIAFTLVADFGGQGRDNAEVRRHGLKVLRFSGADEVD